MNVHNKEEGEIAGGCWIAQKEIAGESACQRKRRNRGSQEYFDSSVHCFTLLKV